MRYADGFGKPSSRVILGTTYFGDGITEADAFALMDRFRELGGTHLDTARMYADGRSEEIIGRWKTSRRADEMLIAGKGGAPLADAPEVMRLSEAEIRADLERSLQALQTDCIDFYWLHRDDVTLPAGEIIRTMNRLCDEGKIRKFGASNWSAERIAEAQSYAEKHGLTGFSASQIRFSPARLNAPMFGLVEMDAEQYAYYQMSKMPVAAYSSQAKGFFSKMDAMGEAGLSAKAKERYLSDANRQTFAVVQTLANKHGCSVAALLCGAFCSLEEPTVFPIVGCRTPEQLEDTMSGADLVLTQEETATVFRNILR